MAYRGDAPLRAGEAAATWTSLRCLARVPGWSRYVTDRNSVASFTRSMLRSSRRHWNAQMWSFRPICQPMFISPLPFAGDAG